MFLAARMPNACGKVPEIIGAPLSPATWFIDARIWAVKVWLLLSEARAYVVVMPSTSMTPHL
jgi:hypothetical protein